MEKTTIQVSKDLRDVIKLGALYSKMSIELYLSTLVQKDLIVKDIKQI